MTTLSRLETIAIRFKPAAVAAVSIFALAAVAAPLASSYAQAPAAHVATITPASIGLPDFAELASKVKPAVVSINVKRIGEPEDEGPESEPQANPFEGTPFEKFFKQAPQGGSARKPEREDKRVSWVAGSGFFISADGYAVTNNHVVEGARKVELIGDDGKHYPAHVIGTDPKTDLALVKAEGRSDFPFVKLATGKPRIGEWALAVGNPFGLGGTVTTGIVSAAGRDIGAGLYDDFIQIDAPINKGNSGGPTFNLQGEVIGVNTAIFSPSGGSIGIAFDIPAHLVTEIIPTLKAKGHVDRGWIGVSVQDVTPDVADSVGLAEAQGAIVAETVAKGPASRAGLKAGDVIRTINGTSVKDSHDLARRIGGLKPQTAVSMGIWRQGHEKRVSLTVKDDASAGNTLALNSGD